MARHAWIGVAGMLVLVVPAAACSSSDKSAGTSTTTVSTPATHRGVAVTPSKPPVRWKLALDYRTHPRQNPFPRSAGGAPVWTLMQSASATPGTYTKLATYAPTFGAGVVAWHGASKTCGGLPAIGVAVARPAKICNVTIPPSAAFLSPDPSHLAVVAWKSPRTADIAVQTGLADLDASCGDGVTYSIDQGASVLTSGTLANDGSKQLPVTQTHVDRGQTVYFIVGPGPISNADCDATQLAVTIDPVA